MSRSQTSSILASVIVPTRNRASYLAECLRLLSDQDCKEPFEIVVIDNDSTDDTSSVIEQWRKKNSKIRMFRETRIGLSAAKNAGARLANGRLLLFADDDVILQPNWVSAYLEWFARIGETNVLVGGPIIPILNDLQPWPHWFDERALTEVGLLDYGTERSLMDWEYVWGANMVIPADVYRRVGPWDESVGRRGDERGTYEDIEYQDRARAAGCTVWFCPAPALKHRVEPERLRTRTLIKKTFSQGRNEVLQETLRSGNTNPMVPASKLLPAAVALAINVGCWTWWTVLFRLIRNRASFAGTRAYAYLTANQIERIRVGRESSRTARIMIRAVFAWNRLLMRLLSNEFT
jgi:glycosyltransferase involved in cell wall biosynthesis